MPETIITQSEADALLRMPKHSKDDRSWNYPGQGARISIPLESEDKREQFQLDITRGRIDLAKCMHQHRARQVVILARLEIHGPPHHNPDGNELACPHLHLYREGFGDKWAFAVPPEHFTHLEDFRQTFVDFVNFCNIVLLTSPQFPMDVF